MSKLVYITQIKKGRSWKAANDYINPTRKVAAMDLREERAVRPGVQLRTAVYEYRRAYA